MKGGEEVKKGMKKESAKLSRQKRSPEKKDLGKPCHQFITWESEGKGGGAVG